MLEWLIRVVRWKWSRESDVFCGRFVSGDTSCHPRNQGSPYELVNFSTVELLTVPINGIHRLNRSKPEIHKKLIDTEICVTHTVIKCYPSCHSFSCKWWFPTVKVSWELQWRNSPRSLLITYIPRAFLHRNWFHGTEEATR